MADVSRTTAKKLANSTAVLAAIEVHGTRIGERAQEVLFRGVEGAPDLASMITQLGVGLKLVEDDYREAEAVYLAERTDNDAVRAARDEAEANVRDVLGGVKSLVTAAFGARYAARVGLGGQLERRPDLVLAQARNVERLLPTVDAPEAQLGGASLDRAALGSSVSAAADTLDAALREVAREEREDQQAMIRRDQAAEVWDRVYTATANMLVALAQAAGEDALADRIRPTSRRRLGIEEPPPEPEEPDVTEPVVADPTPDEPAEG